MHPAFAVNHGSSLFYLTFSLLCSLISYLSRLLSEENKIRYLKRRKDENDQSDISYSWSTHALEEVPPDSIKQRANAFKNSKDRHTPCFFPPAWGKDGVPQKDSAQGLQMWHSHSPTLTLLPKTRSAFAHHLPYSKSGTKEWKSRRGTPDSGENRTVQWQHQF